MRVFSGKAFRLVSLFLLILLTQLPVFVNHFMRSMIDPDIWWHLRVGDWILQNKAFPHVGIFSQHAMDHSWMAYSWGFEVLMASLFRLGGLASIPLTLALFRAIIVFTLFLVLLKVSGRFWPAWLLATVAIFPLTSVLVIRPVLFSNLFFIIELGLLYQVRRTGSIKPLFWMPPLFLIWANTHIQFIYGLAVLGLFVLSEIASRAVKHEKLSPVLPRMVSAPATQVLLVFAASLLATLIGPYWGEVYVVIFRYAGNTAQYNQISELVALAFRMYSDYFVVLLLMAACFALGRKRLDLFSAALLLLSAMVSFRSNRDAWFVTLISCMVVAEGLAKQEEDGGPLTRSLKAQYAAALVLAVALAFAFAGRRGLGTNELVVAVDQMYPVSATEFVRENHLPGPMYNSFEWGGFLIFNLREYPVSIDGRNDFYGPEFFGRVQRTMAAIDWRKDPDLAKANFVLIPKREMLAKALSLDPAYRLVYSDHVAAVFLRTKASDQSGSAGAVSK